jgi:protein JSN1
LETIIDELKNEFVDLCSGNAALTLDYIGNVIIQKLMEKGAETQKLQIIQAVSKHLASLGVHKNGTWAVQKIIDCAKTSAQIKAIVEGLRSYAPALLLDQFGNYVIQCCLRLGEHRNQFIFDAMSNRCWELGQGRFGARAMKACLESQHTTKAQQQQVSMAIIQNCVQLSMNSNGSILITWLMESSQMPGRYRVLAPLMLPHLGILCCHKLANVTVLKISILCLTSKSTSGR